MSSDQSYRQNLQQSMQDWDAGVPQDNWDALNADLREEHMWQRLNSSLEQEGDLRTMQESFASWNAGNHLDGWSRIEEELARERVWNRLNASLNNPQASTTPWLKYLVSSAAAILIAFFLSEQQGPVHLGSHISNEVSGQGVKTSPVADAISEPREIALERLQKQTTVFVTDPVVQTADSEVRSVESFDQVVENVEEAGTRTNTDELLVIDPMHPRGMRNETALLPSERDPFLFPILKPTPYHVRVGTQIALLNERDGSQFNNFFPRASWTADLGYTRQFRGLDWGASIGFTQFAQESGKYLNGRYFSSSQKLNTVQISGTVGKDLGRWTVFAGIQLNKLVFGLEERSNIVTNIYNSNRLNLGGTAGADVVINQFKNGNHVDLGVQYQYIPRVISSNAYFQHVQGLKLQIKYAF